MLINKTADPAVRNDTGSELTVLKTDLLGNHSDIFTACCVGADTLLTASNAIGVNREVRALNNIVIQSSPSPDRLNSCSGAG